MKCAKIALVLCLAFSADVLADSMHCEHGLISRGASKSTVLAACGKPIARNKLNESMRRGVGKHHKNAAAKGEAWHYNFGSRTLMREVRFIDGLVDSITTLGYGFGSNM